MVTCIHHLFCYRVLLQLYPEWAELPLPRLLCQLAAQHEEAAGPRLWLEDGHTGKQVGHTN